MPTEMHGPVTTPVGLFGEMTPQAPSESIEKPAEASDVRMTPQAHYESAEKPANAAVIQMTAQAPYESADKPADASDIQSLEQAKEEIQHLRELVRKFNKAQDDEKNKQVRCLPLSMDPSVPTKDLSVKKKHSHRGIVRDGTSSTEYVKKTVEKSDEVRKIILDSITHNILLKGAFPEEMTDIVDAFEPTVYSANEVVIKQGDQGDLFYVVESGALDIFVRADSSSANKQVGVPYGPGASFGELALMYDKPRSATIAASENCKLWRIGRGRFRDILKFRRMERVEASERTLEKVSLKGKLLTDLLSPPDFKNFASLAVRGNFKKGDVIIREGERGDNFYMIESGTVDVFITANGSQPVLTLQRSNSFGDKALWSEDVRMATCIASSDVVCLHIVRDDFVLIFGNMQNIFDKKKKVIASVVKKKSLTQTLLKIAVNQVKFNNWKLVDLEMKETLGMGSFGRVRLVKMKDTGKNYSLKCISKALIVEGNQEEAIVHEQFVMGELLHHPFIMESFGAVQDDKYIYFLNEVLMGGEFFSVLQKRGRIYEEEARFYAASVLAAFEYIHGINIIYRDLKPENLVLDSAGYVKIIDFGFSKQIKGKTYTVCGTPDYMAPELFLMEGHDKGVDYWAFGVFIYEMVSGDTPFDGATPLEMTKQIVEGRVDNSRYFSSCIFDLIKKLLVKKQSKRLGCIYGGAVTVMTHEWFSGFNWDGLTKMELDVPIKPKLKDADDTSNFDRYLEEDSEVMSSQWQPDFATMEETAYKTKVKAKFGDDTIAPVNRKSPRKLGIITVEKDDGLKGELRTKCEEKKRRYRKMTTAPIYTKDNRGMITRLMSTYEWSKHENNRGALDAKINSFGFGKAMMSYTDVDLDLEPINILCMDGGGMKGFALQAMLQEFMHGMCPGRDLSDLFDLIGGTSVGGLAALTLGHHRTFDKGYETCCEWAEKVRKNTFAKWSITQMITKGHLMIDKREEIFHETFGERTTYVDHAVEGGVKSFAVCVRRELSESSTSNENELEPFLCRTYEIPEDQKKNALPGTHKLPLYLSMTATSAAPKAFNRTVAKIGGENYQLCDGMLLENNPVIIAVREAKLLWPNRPIGNILSFGFPGDEETETNLEAMHMIKDHNPKMKLFRFVAKLHKDYGATTSNLKLITKSQDLSREYIRTSDVSKEASAAVMLREPVSPISIPQKVYTNSERSKSLPDSVQEKQGETILDSSYSFSSTGSGVPDVQQRGCFPLPMCWRARRPK